MTKVPQPGVGEYLELGAPLRFSKTPTNPKAPAAGQPGAHTLEVLNTLGYSENRVRELVDNGVVQQAASWYTPRFGPPAGAFAHA